MVYDEGHNVFVVLLAWNSHVEGHYADIVVVVVTGKPITDIVVIVVGLIIDME